MIKNVQETFSYYIAHKTDSVAGGLREICEGFVGQDMPIRFGSAEEVEEYVMENAGQVGKTVS